jgi:hypothetical protein
LADRGFADRKFFQFLFEELKFDYVIRIKSNTTIYQNEEPKKASELLQSSTIVSVKNTLLTLQKYPVQLFIAVQDKGMKAPWYLVSSCAIGPREVVKLYGKRWKIEP